jgi:RNA polymerase sigma factor (sigma-70 family)
MSTGALRQVLGHLLARDGGGLTDGQLLGRFIADREEAAFAALVRRHGPMVLGVCRRLLRHAQDAEDAFQATFLVLARKAASVIKRESVPSFLYGVAYRTALRARARAAKRRATERQVEDMPHPEVAPAEAQDWRPLLDRELDRLPGNYRAAVILCDLEGRTRREAARQLGLSEGTLSSRLARGRRLLARRLAKSGLTLSGGALAAAMVEGASAAVPAPLVVSTVKAAALVAAGQAVAATPAAALMKEVLKAMLLAKLKVVVAAVMVAAAVGASGFVYRASGEAAAPPARPANELEALRRENELLKLNLEVVLEKVKAQEAELRALKAKSEPKAVHLKMEDLEWQVNFNVDAEKLRRYEDLNSLRLWAQKHDAGEDVESLLKAVRQAYNEEARKRALDRLEAAIKKLREADKPKADTPRKK